MIENRTDLQSPFALPSNRPDNGALMSALKRFMAAFIDRAASSAKTGRYPRILNTMVVNVRSIQSFIPSALLMTRLTVSHAKRVCIALSPKSRRPIRLSYIA